MAAHIEVLSGIEANTGTRSAIAARYFRNVAREMTRILAASRKKGDKVAEGISGHRERFHDLVDRYGPIGN